MNQRELFNATVKHKKHDSVLFYADFTPELETRVRKELNIAHDKTLREHFNMFTPIHVGFKPAFKDQGNKFDKYYEGYERPKGSTINKYTGVLNEPGSMYHFTHYVSPLRNTDSFEEIKKFPYASHEDCSDSHLKVDVDSIHQKGLVASCWVGHMYETAWQIRGYERFLEDMLLEPKNCEYILDKICEFNIQTVVAATMAGVDIIETGDDVANQRNLMFSPELWRHFIKKRWAKVYSAAKSINPNVKIWYHSDGNIINIIPELIEIGVDILNPVQPECLDLIEVKRNFGDKLVLDGTIGTQSTMPFGSTNAVRNAVKNAKRNLGYDGALILSPTHILEPEVPIKNIIAFVDACRE